MTEEHAPDAKAKEETEAVSNALSNEGANANADEGAEGHVAEAVASDEATTSDAAAIAAEHGESKSAAFEAVWVRVLEAWDDDKPHQAALTYALEFGMLPDLAGRYRSLKDDPDKGARAEKKINGIIVAATQMMMATKTPARTKTPWQWNAAAALFFAIVVAFLFYKLFIVRR